MKTLNQHRSVSGAKGFTLVELMITVAIVGILTMIAVPSYQNHVVRTHRSAAKACLSQYSQFMERFYTTRLTYVGAAPAPGCSVEGGLDTRYTFTMENLAANTYTATATPTALWATRDTRCTTLSLDQAGARVAGTGSAADIAYCW